MDLAINADRGQLAVVEGAKLPWLPSPTPGVERRLLERIGGEVALATSIVRYAPGSSFPEHRHDLGEEFLVLEGTFSDESGDFPAGSYVLNPPGSKHSPFSSDGCVIFVKLRQMGPDESESVRIHGEGQCWRVAGQPGIRGLPLYANSRTQVEFLRLEAGVQIPQREVTRGEELLVLEGNLRIAGQHFGPWSWRRSAESRQPAILAATPSLLWVKRGHL